MLWNNLGMVLYQLNLLPHKYLIEFPLDHVCSKLCKGMQLCYMCSIMNYQHSYLNIKQIKHLLADINPLIHVTAYFCVNCS